MPLPVTALFAAVLALWIIFLLMKVVRFRRGHKVSLGTGGDPDGERLIHAHANATETIPIFLILLALSEGLGSPAWFLYVMGAVFCAGRGLHGLHFMQERKGFSMRFYGMILTLSATIFLAIDLLRHTVGL